MGRSQQSVLRSTKGNRPARAANAIVGPSMARAHHERLLCRASASWNASGLRALDIIAPASMRFWPTGESSPGFKPRAARMERDSPIWVTPAEILSMPCEAAARKRARTGLRPHRPRGSSTGRANHGRRPGSRGLSADEEDGAGHSSRARKARPVEAATEPRRLDDRRLQSIDSLTTMSL